MSKEKESSLVDIAGNDFFSFGLTSENSKFLPPNFTTTFRFGEHVKTFWRKWKICLDDRASQEKGKRTIKVDCSIVRSFLRSEDAVCGKT